MFKLQSLESCSEVIVSGSRSQKRTYTHKTVMANAQTKAGSLVWSDGEAELFLRVTFNCKTNRFSSSGHVTVT